MIRMLDTEVGGIEEVSTKQAGEVDYCVCFPWTDPPIEASNQREPCCQCGIVLQVHPTSPRKPPRICVECVSGLIGAS